MGSGSSSGSSGINDIEFGEWEYESSACDCDSRFKIINNLQWVECDIMDRNVKRLANLGRVATLGITENWAAWNDITHDAIQCNVTCYKCYNKPSQTYTFDYCAMGKRYRNGKYTKQYNPKQVIYQKDITNDSKLSLFYLEQIFIKYKPRRKKYNIYKNNCKHFATAFWKYYIKSNPKPHHNQTMAQIEYIEYEDSQTTDNEESF